MPLIAGKKAIDIGVIVSDIDASLNFYVDLLGLEKVQETPLWSVSYTHLRAHET